MALIIHTLWCNLGIKLPKILAWFITFNFIIIAWIFFRAKEWEDAIKVLKDASGLTGIVLPSFLSVFGIRFGNYMAHLIGNISTIILQIFGFIIVLYFKIPMIFYPNMK